MGLLKIKRQEFDTLANEIEILRSMKEVAQVASSAFEDQQAYVIAMMGDQKTAKAQTVKATVVRRPVTTYNEAGIKKALGAVLFRKVSKQVLDKKALEQAVNDGIVDINVIAAHAEVKDSKPYISFSKIESGDDEA